MEHKNCKFNFIKIFRLPWSCYLACSNKNHSYHIMFPLMKIPFFAAQCRERGHVKTLNGAENYGASLACSKSALLKLKLHGKIAFSFKS